MGPRGGELQLFKKRGKGKGGWGVKFPLFSVKGHDVLSSFHVASISVDLRGEVVTDNNANKTHSS